jgi:NAD(P)-dependent dehydrogenase (short-subunit alcohol dehydrogenase family)
MPSRTWLVTGVSSGFGRELTAQLLDRGDTVIGTVRRPDAIADLADKHPDLLRVEVLDVTDTAAVRAVADRSFDRLGRIDVVVSNAGYGLFGAAEELSDAQVDHIIATNLTGSITLIRAALPPLRAQGGGRIVQRSSYGGQVAFPGNSLYHATKWGIEGFCESVAQEVAPFGIGVTIVEPGGARTEFRYGSAQIADLMPEYDRNPAHAFQAMLAGPPAPGDPARMAARIIDSVDIEPAPAADGPRFAGPREHAQHAPPAHRRLRGADRARRLDRPLRLTRYAGRRAASAGRTASDGSTATPALTATDHADDDLPDTEHRPERGDGLYRSDTDYRRKVVAQLIRLVSAGFDSPATSPPSTAKPSPATSSD